MVIVSPGAKSLFINDIIGHIEQFPFADDISKLGVHPNDILHTNSMKEEYQEKEEI